MGAGASLGGERRFGSEGAGCGAGAASEDFSKSASSAAILLWPGVAAEVVGAAGGAVDGGERLGGAEWMAVGSWEGGFTGFCW